jgi:hypothetical protein
VNESSCSCERSKFARVDLELDLIAVIGLELTSAKVRVASTVLNVVDCTRSEPIASGRRQGPNAPLRICSVNP